MASDSFCFFAMAVLLGGTATKFRCVMEQLMIISPDHIFNNPDDSCQNIAEKFSRARTELKKCLHYEIDVTPLETLHHDFCTSNSIYRQKFDRHKACLDENWPNSESCLLNLKDSPTLAFDIFMGSPYTAICYRAAQHASKCLTDRVGKPCGQEGQEVFGRIVKAMEPSFITGTCVAATSDKFGNSETTDETSKAERGVLKTMDQEDERDYDGFTISKANSDLPTLGFILLGLLFTVKWW